MIIEIDMIRIVVSISLVLRESKYVGVCVMFFFKQKTAYEI